MPNVEKIIRLVFSELGLPDHRESKVLTTGSRAIGLKAKPRCGFDRAIDYQFTPEWAGKHGLRRNRMD